jgi:6-phosphogluconolactonase
MRIPMPSFHSFSNPAELAEHLAAYIAACLQADVDAYQAAALVVSGGSTPGPLFRRLSEKDISWDKVAVTLADERWVDPSHPDSNELLVRSLLLQNRAAAALFVPLKNSSATALTGEEECHLRLTRLPRPFTAVILGMGSDGHAASLFPGAERLAKALDPRAGLDCLALSPPHATHERMTLTLPVLLDTRLLVLHITGAAKRAALDRALAGGPVAVMPVRGILRQQRTPVHIYWSP